jgi:hypothetical protein
MSEGTNRQLTWGALKKWGAHLPDDTSIMLEDGNLECISAISAKVCTHKDPDQGDLYKEDESSDADRTLEKLPVPALVIGGNVRFDFPDIHHIE